MKANQIIQGDIREVSSTLPAQSVHCIVTSPPYWNLRDYGHDNQIGRESTPEAYVQTIVDVFRELRRVLRHDGTLWLNLGDSYAANRGYQVPDSKWRDVGNAQGMKANQIGLKPKDLVGIPWRVALALQADGWYLRSDIIWNKKNPMPESVTDRPTKAHEYIFLMAKSERYYYDADAIREPYAETSLQRISQPNFNNQTGGPKDYQNGINPNRSARKTVENFKKTANGGRNKRTVWTVPTKPYQDAHFAVFPPDLILPCILAGCPPGGIVLDPFMGSGTVAQVAIENGRNWLGVELNPDYIKLAMKRINQAQPALISL